MTDIKINFIFTRRDGFMKTITGIYCFFLLIMWSPLSGKVQPDSCFIQPFEQNFSVRINLSKPFLFLSQSNASVVTGYCPNNPFKGGIGVAIKNTLINFSIGQEFNFLRDKQRGKTEAFDLQIHHYGRAFVFDFSFQQYKGFYTEDDKSKLIQLYPDLKITQYGVHGQYVLNHKRFSYKAAFPQSEKQVNSAGSVLLGGCIYFANLESDSSFRIQGGRTFHNFQFGINGGYTHTWVLNPHWFVNASIMAGVNIGNEKIRHFGKRKIEVYPSGFPRIALGYNHENWAFVASALANIIYLSTQHANWSSLHSGTIQFSYIRRFYFSRKPFCIRSK